MAAFIKSLSRFLGASAKPAPGVHLAAFGKHPGWNDHLDDLGLETDALIAAKRLLYVQGISQNIDSGAWDKLEAPAAGEAGASAAAGGVGRLELFRHDFFWQMPEAGGEAPLLLVGRLWSSSDGKGRAKYPMVVCSELADLPDRFAAEIVLPQLAQVQEQCAAATDADTVRQILQREREKLRGRIKDAQPGEPLSARRLAAIAGHPAMLEGRVGFHRIVYQFASGLAAYRTPAAKSAGTRRPEQLRLPACGMAPAEALVFWLRFALTFVDPSTPLLLVAPDQGEAAPWVDLIAGEPAPGNIFCIKAGTRTLPFTSDIPYTLDPALVRVIDAHIAFCQSAADSTPLPPWPMFQQ